MSTRKGFSYIQRLTIPLKSTCCAFCSSISFKNFSLLMSTTLFSLKYLIQLVAQSCSNLVSSLLHWFLISFSCCGSSAFTTFILSRQPKKRSLLSQHCFLEDLVGALVGSSIDLVLLNQPIVAKLSCE